MMENGEQVSKPLFTIFTATYNRAHTLPRVYRSLKIQTCRDFEWVIVDDGSTDNTYDLVKRWKEEADFPIRYFWQQNQGKHFAFNWGVKEAHGRFFLSLDSDDACVSEALERFKYHWDLIPKDQEELFTGVCSLCQDQNGMLIGNRFPFNPTDSNSLEIYYRYKVWGDKWGFQRVEVLRNFPFPEIEGTKFIPEGIVWNSIAKSFKIRFINEILGICYIQPFSSSDQLTCSLNDPLRYAVGSAYYYQSCLNNDIEWFRYAPFKFLLLAVHYVRFSLHSGKKVIEALTNVRLLKTKILVAMAIPIGVIFYSFEKRGINLILRSR